MSIFLSPLPQQCFCSDYSLSALTQLPVHSLPTLPSIQPDVGTSMEGSDKILEHALYQKKKKNLGDIFFSSIVTWLICLIWDSWLLPWKYLISLVSMMFSFNSLFQNFSLVILGLFHEQLFPPHQLNDNDSPVFSCMWLSLLRYKVLCSTTF